jgi:hypothetical protein
MVRIMSVGPPPLRVVFDASCQITVASHFFRSANTLNGRYLILKFDCNSADGHSWENLISSEIPKFIRTR